MTLQRHHDGKLVILENETYVNNEHGTPVRRVEMVLEDGTEVIQDMPMNGFSANHYPPASAPTEDDIEIPVVHATAVPESYSASTSRPPQSTSSSPLAVVTGPPEPPRVAIVTGPPRPPVPPQVITPSSRYVYRDERSGACVICGLSACVFFLICCCCFLPLVIIPIVWATSWNDSFHEGFDDDFFNDDHF